MSAWAYVEDGIPDNGVSVLVTFTDRGGRRRATVATLYGEQELESVDQDDRCGGVYDEDTDKYWAPPGWYETPWSAEEVYPLDGEAVAWRPLEVAPEKPADDYTARMAEAQATREELGRDHTEDPPAMVEPSCIDFAADSPLHQWEYKTLRHGRQARRCSVCWRLDTWSPPRGYQGQAVEVAEPKSAVGLAVEELRRREGGGALMPRICAGYGHKGGAV